MTGTSRFSKLSLPTALLSAVLLCFSSNAAGQALQLQYDAFVGVAHAGTISVNLERNEQTYSVRGEAESKGLMQMIKDLSAWFSAKGRISQGEPQLDVYEYYQKDKQRERFVSVANGEVTYVKNGETRPTQPAYPGVDLVTALWVLADCESIADVHTGRSSYRFDLVEKAEDTCSFSVQEDDPDEAPFELSIRYGQRDGLKVPVSIHSTGGWAGRMHLIE